ncbi:MAG: helix-turn-helix domain-containing protein [Burkholderiales bacterium]|nr:helix-turn-helix domain-containing protein [Burkholderiales bacterium]
MPDSDQDASSRGSVRAVVRALRLLRLMNERAVWTLHELHGRTGLPKSTLSRLLATLRDEGYVLADAVAGSYRLGAKVRDLDGGYTEASRLVETGRTILLRVTRQIKWPLALATPDGDAIVVRYSSMPYSPLAVQTTTLGHRLGWCESALGRAYLAFCSAKERACLLDALHGAEPAPAARARIEQELAQVRAAGHAVRQPGAGVDSATLAVPVLVRGEAAAALSMTTFGKSMTRRTIAEHAPILVETARAIAEAYEAAG